MANTYFTLLTKVGQARMANAIALNTPMSLTQMAVGDGLGNPTTPNENQTALLREKYRASINQLTIDSANPNYVIAELVIPTTVGGWAVNEVGVFDNSGNLIAIANFPATYKPQLAEGSGRDLIIRIYIQVSNAALVNLVVDPAVVLASQAWVITNFSRAKILPGGTTNQLLAKNSNADGDTKWIDATSAQNVTFNTLDEIQTLAAAQLIVDLAVVTTNGVGVFIEGVRLRSNQFTVNSPTRITLATAYPVGTKLQAVQNEQLGISVLARKDGADFTGTVTGVTPPQFDNSKKFATMEALQKSGLHFQSTAGISLSANSSLTASQAGHWFALANNITVTLPSASLITNTATYTFVVGSGSATLQASGAELIFSGSTAGAGSSSIVLRRGQTATIVANSTGWYVVMDGFGLGSFSALKATTGWDKLPSDIIRQWGTGSTNNATGLIDIVFPIAFPNAILGLVVSEAAGSAWTASSCTVFGSDLRTTAGARVYSRQVQSGGVVASANGFFNYMATGY